MVRGQWSDVRIPELMAGGSRSEGARGRPTSLKLPPSPKAMGDGMGDRSEPRDAALWEPDFRRRKQ